MLCFTVENCFEPFIINKMALFLDTALAKNSLTLSKLSSADVHQCVRYLYATPNAILCACAADVTQCSRLDSSAESVAAGSAASRCSCVTAAMDAMFLSARRYRFECSRQRRHRPRPVLTPTGGSTAPVDQSRSSHRLRAEMRMRRVTESDWNKLMTVVDSWLIAIEFVQRH